MAGTRLVARACCFALALALPPADAATLYVNPRHPAASDQAAATAETPLRSLGEAARRVQPGDTVRIAEGVYRESVVVERSGTPEQPIRFESEPGARVIITGADLLGDWTREPGPEAVFSTLWDHVFMGWTKRHAHPDDDYHELIGRAEQVFVADYALRQVLRRDLVTRGTFFVDEAAKRLHVQSADNADLTKQRVEASVRPVVWQSRGAYVQVRGLCFRYAANHAQEGAAQFHAHSLVEDCAFERTNASGAVFLGEGIVVRRCSFTDNGQLGFGANGAHNLLFTGCLVARNNAKGFSRGWEAGGDKLVLCRRAVLESSQFVANRGCGVWFDIGNEECEVRRCLIADNDDAGIFYEISYALRARDNVIVGNGLADTPGAWGAAAGICLSSSPGAIIERNLLAGNKEGLNYREQMRTTPLIGDGAERPVWNHDQRIEGNLLAYNRDAQLRGWFDVGDERHWPAALQEKRVETGQAAANIAGDYLARDAKGQPVGLSLARLKLSHERNVFARTPTQALFVWGVAWKRNQTYVDLAEVRRELGLEQDSVTAEAPFADWLTRDLRLPADHPALRLGSYPRGEVPGTRLGAK